MTTDERDIFHSEPAPGAIERGWTGYDFTLTFSTDDELFFSHADKSDKHTSVKLNRKTKDGDTHTTLKIILPICKRKDVK